MNLRQLKIASILTLIALALMALAYLAGRWQREQAKPLPPIADVPTHDVKATVRALDKPTLRRKRVISKAVENMPGEVTATGTIRDSDGTRHVAAVLDPDTGESVIFQHRPVAEILKRNEIGIGAGYGARGLMSEIYYVHTPARVWNLYVSGSANLIRYERDGYEGQVWVRAGWRF